MLVTNSALNETALSLAQDYLQTEAALLEVLSQIEKRRAYLDFGCGDLFSYCVERLKLSRAQAYYFLKVARKSEEVPALKAAVAKGTLSLSQARRIVPVLTPENAASWIEKAATLKQPALELEVAKASPRGQIHERLRPVAPELCDFRCGVTPEFMQAFLEIQDLVSKSKRAPASMPETLEAMKEVYLEKHSPVRRAERAQRRVSCRKQNPPLRAAKIDGKRTAVRAEVLHQVALRDRGRCCFRSRDGHQCTQTRWTDVHHIIAVSEGGGHSIDNLITYCSAHHHELHRMAG
jgi:hypothetical protein